MATHSIILAWRIPWIEELGGLQSSSGSQKNRTNSAAEQKQEVKSLKSRFLPGWREG